MSTQKFSLTILVFSVIFLTAIRSYAQYTTADEAKDFINDRLSHSLIQKIDPDGTVTMSTPGEKVKFNLKDVSFNFNGGNNDERVRVACDNCIEHYEHKILTEKSSRQSFLCESEKEANLVIQAFRFLKKKYAADPKKVSMESKTLKVADSSYNTKTVAEAIDFINENLSYSVITGIDETGMMTINSPDEFYQVNLSQAEFGYNDDSDGSKVRIYGNFCIGQKKGNGDKEMIARKSFQTPSRVRAYKVITVLYYLKSTYSNIDPANIPGLQNLSAAHSNSYSNVAEAISYINARLTYSIILGMDNSGTVTINAPEEIYQFNLNTAKLSSARNQKSRSEWFPIIFNSGSTTGVLAECSNCIRKSESPGSTENLDEQVFQCGSSSEVRDVLKAFTYLKSTIKK